MVLQAIQCFNNNNSNNTIDTNPIDDMIILDENMKPLVTNSFIVENDDISANDLSDILNLETPKQGKFCRKKLCLFLYILNMRHHCSTKLGNYFSIFFLVLILYRFL